jgi:RimJ/RimL family protein N-acetyltransferase
VANPALETERLLLREWRESDVEDYARICSDPEVMRYMFPPRAHTYAEAAADARRLREHWERWGFGHWAVEERATGRFVGRTGFKRHPDWPLDPDNTECGWLFAREVWGRGYATEAARAAVRFGFEELNRPEVISIARPGNAASRRVMEKAGLSYAGARRWEEREIDVVWYSARPARPQG